MPENLSKLAICGHCNNISYMVIISNVNDTVTDVDPEFGPIGQYGTTYSVLKCPACENPNIISYEWHDSMESEEELYYVKLYPLEKNMPIGLPDEIKKAYQAAQKVKSVDVNAYVILLRRLLELVCIDRNAKGKVLAQMLEDLADKKEIPDKLVSVAKGLKEFGNLGAHAGIGQLSVKEVPIVTALSNAILEYVYSAPHLASIAESKLHSIKSKKKF